MDSRNLCEYCSNNSDENDQNECHCSLCGFIDLRCCNDMDEMEEMIAKDNLEIMKYENNNENEEDK